MFVLAILAGTLTVAFLMTVIRKRAARRAAARSKEAS